MRILRRRKFFERPSFFVYFSTNHRFNRCTLLITTTPNISEPHAIAPTIFRGFRLVSTKRSHVHGELLPRQNAHFGYSDNIRNGVYFRFSTRTPLTVTKAGLVLHGSRTTLRSLPSKSRASLRLNACLDN